MLPVGQSPFLLPVTHHQEGNQEDEEEQDEEPSGGEEFVRIILAPGQGQPKPRDALGQPQKRGESIEEAVHAQGTLKGVASPALGPRAEHGVEHRNDPPDEGECLRIHDILLGLPLLEHSL